MYNFRFAEVDDRIGKKKTITTNIGNYCRERKFTNELINYSIIAKKSRRRKKKQNKTKHYQSSMKT